LGVAIVFCTLLKTATGIEWMVRGPVTQNEINSFKVFLRENALAKSGTMAIMGSNGILTILVPGANSNSRKKLGI